jgi:Saxitoxin biosynthesis operon protein SxtJ
VFLLLGEWFLFRNKPAGPYFLTPGVLLVVFGLVAPRSLKIAYIAWMSLAFTMGLLVSTVVLTIFYFLVITPIGIGGDYLARTSFPKRLIGKLSLNSINARRTTRPSAGSRFFAGVSLATFRTFCQ